MGEILRAVMDKSCLFSNPAFYTIESPPAVGAGAIVNLVSYLETKVDRWFLCTGLGQQRFNAALGAFDNGDAKIQLRTLKGGRVIYNNPIPQLLAGQDFTQTLTFPEYILIGPNETIQMNTEVASSANNWIYSVCLFGIEYAP